MMYVTEVSRETRMTHTESNSPVLLVAFIVMFRDRRACSLMLGVPARAPGELIVLQKPPPPLHTTFLLPIASPSSSLDLLIHHKNNLPRLFPLQQSLLIHFTHHNSFPFLHPYGNPLFDPLCYLYPSFLFSFTLSLRSSKQSYSPL